MRTARLAALAFALAAITMFGATEAAGASTPSGSPLVLTTFKKAVALPGAFFPLESMVAEYRGAYPAKVQTLSSTAVQVKDAKGTYILSQSPVDNSASATESTVHMVVGLKLTSWVVNTATGAAVSGPVTVGGTSLKKTAPKKVPHDTTTTASSDSPQAVFYNHCKGVVWQPYLEDDTEFGPLVDGYMTVKCNTLVDLIQSQRLWQFSLRDDKWETLSCCNIVITEPISTNYWNYSAYAPCDKIGQVRSWRQYGGIYIEWLDDGGISAYSGMTKGRNLPCNTL